MSSRGGCQQIGEANSNHSTALTSANELARTRALRSLRNGFDYIARFFKGSLQAVEERNPGVKGTFDHIDSRRFSAVLYKHGKAVSECSIRLEGMGRRSDGIAFSYDASARQGSYNEMLHVETNAQALFFRAMGMQMGGGAPDAQLSPEGAAEFLWDLLISLLQE